MLVFLGLNILQYCWLSEGRGYTLQPSYLNEFVAERQEGLGVRFENFEGMIFYVGTRSTCTANAMFLVLGVPPRDDNIPLVTASFCTPLQTPCAIFATATHITARRGFAYKGSDHTLGKRRSVLAIDGKCTACDIAYCSGCGTFCVSFTCRSPWSGFLMAI